MVATDAQGRVVTPPTVEFRLPDGSALPHLLLAGAALAMIHGRETQDLDDLLQRTSAEEAAARAARATRLPSNFAEVADALQRYRGTLELGGTFPAALIDRLLASLKR